MSTTNLKNELIEDNSDNLDFSRQDDVEHIVSELIISRSDSAEEVTERTAQMIEMLKPENAQAIFRESVMYLGERSGGFFVHEEVKYDAYLNVITPWLVKQGFPDLRPKQ